MKFTKYQALGNDYLVAGPNVDSISASYVSAICDRHFGVGADGVLIWKKLVNGDVFELRIFNPDGSEAKKSGNGIRIFCRYLFDTHRVSFQRFVVETLGGRTVCRVREDLSISVEMGYATFPPVSDSLEASINSSLPSGCSYVGCCLVDVGNLHCVVYVDRVDEILARHAGALIERLSFFPDRTNVQFVDASISETERIEIWERGAGYTLASGSSSCAVAAASVKKGRCCVGEVRVQMPGGCLRIDVDAEYKLLMTGPALAVAKIEMM